MGGDLTWTCIGNDSFMVNLTLYRDCNAINMTNAPIDVRCNSTNVCIMSFSVHVPSEIDITPVCNSSCTRCNSTSCVFPYGIEKYIFTHLFVINGAGSCCEIRFEFYTTVRNSNITTGAANQEFYIDAKLNRCLTPCDNSPQFTNPPLMIICINQDYRFNNGAQDMDTTAYGSLLDSISYEWTPPIGSVGKNLSYISPYTYDKPIYFYDFPAAGLAPPKGFHLNARTGDISFRPMLIECTVMVLKVKEYRNGILIGEVKRDIEIIVVNCQSNHNPSLGPSIYSKEVCGGNTVTFNISTTDVDVNDTLTIRCDHSIPGATWSDNNGTVKQPSGVFSWTPSENLASLQPYQFLITVKDNACPIYGQRSQMYQIFVSSGKANYHVADSSCGLFYFRASGALNNFPDSFKWTSPIINFSPQTSPLKIKKLYPGIYPFSLKSSYKGCYKIYNDTLRVDSNLIVPRLTVNKSTQCLYSNSFIFFDSSFIHNGLITTRYIDFGDGFSTSKICDTHTYNSPGTFRVRLTITDSLGCFDTAGINVVVNKFPSCDFTIDNDRQCLAGNLFAFSDSTDNAGVGINEYGWDMGNGVVFKAKDSQYTYLHADTIYVSHWAIDDNGCSDTMTKMVVVHPMPEAMFTLNDTNQCYYGNQFTTNNLSSIPFGSFSSCWNTGYDSGTSTRHDTSFHYLKNGRFKIKLLVTSGEGCQDSLFTFVNVNPEPAADFTVNNTLQCLAGNRFVFANKSSLKSGKLFSLWSFGDMTYDTVFSPVKSYSDTNTCLVRLIAISEEGCSDTLEKKVKIIPNPIVNIGQDTVVYDNQSIDLDAGAGFDSYLWSTGKTVSKITVDSSGTGFGTKCFWVMVMKDSCPGYDSVFITFKHFVSVNNQISEKIIRIYPNPVSTILNIGLKGITDEVILILTDVLGKQIRFIKVMPENNSDNQKMEIENLSNGVYYLNIYYGNVKNCFLILKN